MTVDATDEFLDALEGVDDPEDKRKIIGRTFIDVFEREAAKIPGVGWLAQGTIYPDVIESAASKHGKAHVIKSHHNVGGLPERMGLKLVEPLRDLFKDEVRAVGLALGLPDRLVYRHPFPGPGLGVRVLGEVKRGYLDVLREADAIYIEELREAGYYDKVAQAFAVYLPVKSVGVVGDARRHEHVIGLRAVVTTDFMTANWAELPHDLIARVSNRIVNELAGVSPGRLRRDQQAAGDDRVGVAVAARLVVGHPADSRQGGCHGLIRRMRTIRQHDFAPRW